MEKEGDVLYVRAEMIERQRASNVGVGCEGAGQRPPELLDGAEFEAVLDAPDPSTWTGRRDGHSPRRALLLVAVHTGLRVSELRLAGMHRSPTNSTSPDENTSSNF